MTLEQREEPAHPNCPFCDAVPRYLPHKAGFYEEKVICDACGFSLPPALWSKRAEVATPNARQWISVKDRLPAPGVLVMVWQPRQEWNYPDDLLVSFDCIDPDDDDAATWRGHNNWYEEYCIIGKPEGSTGPSQDAPYTHWKPMDAAPTIPAIPGTKEGA